jgi:CRP/FNR family transcriptional regulator, cyclic AMP receptor protein
MAIDSPNGSYVKTDVSFESFFAKADFGACGWSAPREYPALTEIIEQDRPARAVYFIEYGLVKLSRIETSGHEVIAGLRRRNWIIGAPAVLLGKKYSFTATALVDCKIRHISSERFLSLVETNPEFSRHMLRMFSQEIFNYGKAFCDLGSLPAIDRLKRLLYEIMLEINHPSVYKEQVKLNFPLKHKELAQMIAVTPEHLSRLLKQLERDGIIKREKGLLVLNNGQSLSKECGGQ